MLLDDLIKESENLLKNQQISSFKIDVLLISCASFGFTKEDIFLKRKNYIPTLNQIKSFNLKIKRRLNREPISHILEERYFYEDIFFVNKNVLDPRPDSESVIYAACDIFPNKFQKLNILEVGVGSGCLILSLLKKFINSQAVAVDISQDALNVAQKNADNLLVSDRLKLYKSDIFSALDNHSKFDLIISNPPYIPTQDIDNLEDEVKNHEPITALDGGKDGLFFYQNIAQNIDNFLKKDGLVILEIGFGQQKDVVNIFQRYGFRLISIKKDLNNIPRCLIFIQT